MKRSDAMRATKIGCGVPIVLALLACQITASPVFAGSSFSVPVIVQNTESNPVPVIAQTPVIPCGRDDSSTDLVPNGVHEGADLERCSIWGGVPIPATTGGGLDLSGINLSFSKLSKALMAYDKLVGANFRAADLSGANLHRADLTGANFQSGANLSGANLTGADLTDASFANANLHGANLSNAILVGVTWLGNTKCPDGTFSGDHGNSCADNLRY
jgi:hypothetical protein